MKKRQARTLLWVAAIALVGFVLLRGAKGKAPISGLFGQGKTPDARGI